ncbi:E3 ubiquitin- ligase TRIM39-like protein [Labeo rohita]|uniref:E3 ubiquitin-ligase TRIM39-like protein n=1 Tax=Labeo rohita TaxID=84645 RepID=A0A498NEL8_LABRO|nr:E3 ubiquitin- ligase TRIM39-like protein [Labeo rohita]
MCTTQEFLLDYSVHKNGICSRLYVHLLNSQKYLSLLQKIKWIRGVQQNDDLRLDESKYIIRELAAELDRVVQDSVPRQWVKSKQRSKNTVWNWITRSTADVVLDPNTANPDLLVSEDGKYLRAKKYGHESWKEFQIKRSKFDGWTCVQAKEGYNTGHHYWEVDVRKKHEWRVGVVKESALRNGYVTMNTKAGYWNLRLQLGTLMALTEPVTKLNLLKPSKIGVYLNLEEGHVSFYDAEKRRHIYTFNTECTGKENIYPMFGTVETDRALMISS